METPCTDGFNYLRYHTKTNDVVRLALFSSLQFSLMKFIFLYQHQSFSLRQGLTTPPPFFSTWSYCIHSLLQTRLSLHFSLMFRIRPTTSRSTLLRSPSTFHPIRLFHPSFSARAKAKRQKIDSSELIQVPETAQGLSAYLNNAYTSKSSRRAQADNKRVNIVNRKLCGQFIYILSEQIMLTHDR